MTFSIKKFTNKTMIPLSALIVFYYFVDIFIGVKNKTEQNALALEKVDSTYDQVIEKLNQNSEKLSRIEGILEILIRGKE